MKRSKFFSDYFAFSKKERIGISALLVLIIISLLAPVFLSKKSKPIAITNNDTAWIVRLQASLVEDSNAKRNSTLDDEDLASYQYDRSTNTAVPTTLFKFDPNTISKEQWKQLGLRDKTVQTITNYLNKGGHFYKAEDLKKIYGLRENDYERLAPYITIARTQTTVPSAIQNQSQTQTSPQSYPKSQPSYSIIEINIANKEALIQLPGIGNTFATRIINFRDKLGGFYSVEQVKETYGLPDSTFQKIKSKLRADESVLKKVNINTATIEELKAHPYLRPIANVLVNYRKEHGDFTNLLQLKNTTVITDEIYTRVFHYLTIQ